MSITPQAFHFHLRQLIATEKYLIAYSGGIDSHVLLHLCAQLKNSPSGFEQSFSAVYIDHGLSSNSKKWGLHCQHICFALDIPLTIIKVDASPKNGQSPEAAARTARYQAFNQLLAEDECLLTAQHLDDQAETLLLQLLRGSGTRGLSAMPRVKSFAKGFLCRPILDYRKKEIIDYARQHQLEWVEDESNYDQCFDRNFLRHTILPALAQHWPAVQENLAKSAEVQAESQMLLDSMAATDIEDLLFSNANGVTEYNQLLLKPTLKILRQSQEFSQQQVSYQGHQHEFARLNNLIRYWIRLNDFPLPSKKILEQIIRSVIHARDDAMPVVSWKRDEFYCEIRRYQNRLYLLDASYTIEKAQKQPLIEGQIVKLPGDNGRVFMSLVDDPLRSQCYDRKKLLSKELTIAFREGGERFRKTAKGHSHTLKHWFQEHAIPPWERTRMPLIFWGDELIQVGNYIVNQSINFFADEQAEKDIGEKSLLIHWQRTENK